MATYVISDIHGAYYRFIDLLNQVKFDQSKDTLYILGDLTDRCGNSDKVLEWVYNQSNAIKCCRGNHEDMMLAEMKRYHQVENDDENLFDFMYQSIWINWNGGLETFEYLTSLPRAKRDDLLNWISGWPLYYDIKVGDYRYLLVHAGVAPKGVCIIDDSFDRGDQSTFFIDGIETKQWAQTLLWIRNTWLFDFNTVLPYSVVFGHTPTSYFYYELKDSIEWLNEDNDFPYDIGLTGSEDHIVTYHANHHPKSRRIAIDTGRDIMGMIRINEDGTIDEFYSDIEE